MSVPNSLAIHHTALETSQSGPTDQQTLIYPEPSVVKNYFKLLLGIFRVSTVWYECKVIAVSAPSASFLYVDYTAEHAAFVPNDQS